MRILIVSEIFLPQAGGPATFGARLARTLADEGHAVRVFCTTREAAADEGGAPYRVVRGGGGRNRLFQELDLRQRLLRAVARADIVYCMGLEHQVRWACRLARKRYILRVGGDRVWEACRNLGTTALEPEAFYRRTTAADRAILGALERRRRLAMRDASAVIYVSEYIRRLAALWDDRRPRVERVIPNGVSAVDRCEVRGRRSSEPLRLLFVGRQTNWKGVDAVLLALRHQGDCRLTVAGAGPAGPANRDLARRLGLQDRVRFLGHVDPHRVGALMAGYHVLVLPSLYEGSSNTLLEAATAGLACIASDRGGNPEVIDDGRTGLLVDPFDVAALGEAIGRLNRDERLRRALARGHRDRVRAEFPLDRAVQETLRLLVDRVR